MAVKVIKEGGTSDAQVFRNAVELAVLSTLSHPNIVQVLTFFTEVGVAEGPGVVGYSGSSDDLETSPPPIKLFPPFSVIPESAVSGGVEPPDGGVVAKPTALPKALVICMEYCDGGSLADAIGQGVFRMEQPSGEVKLMWWLCEVLKIWSH